MTTATEQLQQIAEDWAKKLGGKLVEDTPEQDEPIIYNRGELPPADTRTEHDRSL